MSKPGEERQMCCKEFEDLLLGIPGPAAEAVPARDVPHAFLMAVMVYSDELYNFDFCQLSFVEFLHGLGAIAFLRHESQPLEKSLDRLLVSLSHDQPAGLLTGLLRTLA